ncbi:MAG TPA: hypothetical protein VMX94_07045 [Armatimonadota bacterium]|nr:hypothetical protein [Thermoguttaceae bacterium]HUV04848.1 hypothetical protein [Armatimonadota bacterium]
MTWPDLIKMTPDIVTALAVVVGVIVAALGLKTWRRELQGRARYELALSILMEVREIRDAIHSFRRKLAELDGPPDLMTKWEKIREPLKELDSDLKVANIIFGDRLHKPKMALKECTDEIILSINSYRRQQESKQKDERRMEKMDSENAILWGKPDDEFSRKVDAAVGSFDDELLVFLRR